MSMPDRRIECRRQRIAFAMAGCLNKNVSTPRRMQVQRDVRKETLKSSSAYAEAPGSRTATCTGPPQLNTGSVRIADLHGTKYDPRLARVDSQSLVCATPKGMLRAPGSPHVAPV